MMKHFSFLLIVFAGSLLLLSSCDKQGRLQWALGGGTEENVVLDTGGAQQPSPVESTLAECTEEGPTTPLPTPKTACDPCLRYLPHDVDFALSFSHDQLLQGKVGDLVSFALQQQQPIIPQSTLDLIPERLCVGIVFREDESCPEPATQEEGIAKIAAALGFTRRSIEKIIAIAIPQENAKPRYNLLFGESRDRAICELGCGQFCTGSTISDCDLECRSACRGNSTNQGTAWEQQAQTDASRFGSQLNSRMITNANLQSLSDPSNANNLFGFDWDSTPLFVARRADNVFFGGTAGFLSYAFDGPTSVDQCAAHPHAKAMNALGVGNLKATTQGPSFFMQKALDTIFTSDFPITQKNWGGLALNVGGDLLKFRFKAFGDELLSDPLVELGVNANFQYLDPQKFQAWLNGTQTSPGGACPEAAAPAAAAPQQPAPPPPPASTPPAPANPPAPPPLQSAFSTITETPPPANSGTLDAVLRIVSTGREARGITINDAGTVTLPTGMEPSNTTLYFDVYTEEGQSPYLCELAKGQDPYRGSVPCFAGQQFSVPGWNLGANTLRLRITDSLRVRGEAILTFVIQGS